MSDEHSKENADLKLMVKPTHYELIYVQIDLVDYTFSGTCKLHCTVITMTSSPAVIQLHSLDLY
jgi:hypothetical protein